MKKWLLPLIILVLILLIFLPYLLIPRFMLVSGMIKVNIKSTTAFRTLLNENEWRKWWPSDGVRQSENLLTYQGRTYRIADHFYNAVGIDISNGNAKKKSKISIIPVNTDSVLLVWAYSFPSSLNPFTRIKEFGESRSSEKAMNNILRNMASFLNKPENVYGIAIHVEMSMDSTLISTKFETDGYPTTENIYEAIGSLRDYIHNNQAKEINYPMLHIDQTGSSRFQTMVAIPLNKALPDKGKFEFKRFVPWKVLTAEVKGGDYTVKRAFHQFTLFIQDYGVQQMANSFESLVTDRKTEKDTTKWITRFYMPIP